MSRKTFCDICQRDVGGIKVPTILTQYFTDTEERGIYVPDICYECLATLKKIIEDLKIGRRVRVEI